MEKIDKGPITDSIDIYREVLEMRKDRCHMVFLYFTLTHNFLEKLTDFKSLFQTFVIYLMTSTCPCDKVKFKFLTLLSLAEETDIINPNNFQLNRGKICVANFIPPCKWCMSM